MKIVRGSPPYPPMRFEKRNGSLKKIHVRKSLRRDEKVVPTDAILNGPPERGADVQWGRGTGRSH